MYSLRYFLEGLSRLPLGLRYGFRSFLSVLAFELLDCFRSLGCLFFGPTLESFLRFRLPPFLTKEVVTPAVSFPV